ncbi:MAG: hypothetical protein ACJ8AT_06165 [Hyalangium sp.]|uniref:hypothetical protein n=1 Tax=Hyalangium sp. TaxID=2028555 RepID=UPI00389ACF54
MLTVGVAIRMGKRPAHVARWPMEEIALVAAYCELEAEQTKQTANPPSEAPGPGAVVHRRTVFHAAPREKKS